jgi:hypothetical protein
MNVAHLDVLKKMKAILIEIPAKPETKEISFH